MTNLPFLSTDPRMEDARTPRRRGDIATTVQRMPASVPDDPEGRDQVGLLRHAKLQTVLQPDAPGTDDDQLQGISIRLGTRQMRMTASRQNGMDRRMEPKTD